MSAFGIPLIGVIGYRIAMLEASQNLPEKAADLRVLLASREVEIIGFKAELRSRDFLIEKLKHRKRPVNQRFPINLLTNSRA